MSDAVVELTSIAGIGAKRALELVSRGVKNTGDLRRPDIYATLPAETRLHLDYPVAKEIPLDVADRFVKTLPEYITVLGSYRRRKPILHDIDMFTTVDIKRADREFTSAHHVMGKIVDGKTRISYIVEFESLYIHVDLFHAPESERGAATLHWTGSALWNVKCRFRAKKRGYKLNEKGLWRDGKRVPADTEREILEKIGVEWKPPEQRN